MTDAAEKTLKKELEANERLLWSGMPRQGLLLRPSDAFMVPFSLFWGGFAAFWEYGASAAPNAPAFFPIFGIPFVLIGIYLIAGRFFADSYQRSRTYYGLTNQRVLIVSGIVSRDITTLSLRNLNEISLNERSDGSGSILFSQMNRQFGMTDDSFPMQYGLPGREAIDYSPQRLT